nr:uncharacterized protein LOC104102933 isoform X3 [Nicotiana tomentosiformis]
MQGCLYKLQMSPVLVDVGMKEKSVGQQERDNLELFIGNKGHRFKPPHHAKQSLVFKWRRVEGRAHYPPSFEGCGWSKGSVPDGFLGHQKKKKGTQHCSKGPLCRDHHKATLAGTV